MQELRAGCPVPCWEEDHPGGFRPGDERLASPADSDRLLDQERCLALDAQKGDRDAFAALASSYYERLYRWLYHLTRDRHAAEDLTQETLLKAFAALDRFKAGTNFRA